MRVIATGDLRSEPVLLDSDKVDCLIIFDSAGDPAVIYKFLEHGYARYTRGEDACF